MKRCILIFPDFPNIEAIERVREKYDPLFGFVRPHITLVFPFESDIAAETLREHMRAALAGVNPFRLTLQGITDQRGFGNYLLLNVHLGKNTIKDMHRRLYAGVLEPFLPHWGRNFEPHMTVGKIADDDYCVEAVEKLRDMCELFDTCVSEVYVEIIGDDESSSIETVIKLPV